MNAFVKNYLKLTAPCEIVKVTPLPNSTQQHCIKNVDEFCKKIKSAKPILAWTILSHNGIILANLHAVLEIKGLLKDITPSMFQEKTRMIVREHRMTVAKARKLTQVHKNSFCDIMNIPFAQPSGINFFEHI